MASEANHDSHLHLSLGGADPAGSRPSMELGIADDQQPLDGGPPPGVNRSGPRADASVAGETGGLADRGPTLLFFDIESTAPLPTDLPRPGEITPRFGRSPSVGIPSGRGPAATGGAAGPSAGQSGGRQIHAGSARPGTPLAAATPGSENPATGSIWLSGDVLMCGCPDCAAPMSIRLWLMVADCWQCGTSIELTEQQEREARRLLDEQARGKSGQPATSPARQPSPAPAVGKQPPAETAVPATRPADKALTGPQAPATRPSPGQTRPSPGQTRPSPGQTRPSPGPGRTAPTNRVRRRIHQLAARRGVHVWLRETLRMTPAWLISLVFHLVMLTILGMLSFSEAEGPFITLSSSVDRQLVREGEQPVTLKPDDEGEFDLPIPDDVDLTQQEQREAVVKADQDARELRIDPDVAEPNLPDLQQVKKQVQTAGHTRQSLAARDPRLRVEVVQREGGTTLTEAAVARGLRWLAEQQNADGSWSLHKNGGAVRNDSAGTSLALLPFLGAGQSHLVGRYRNTVSRGLRWLVQHQKPDGDVRGSNDNSGMYSQGQGTIVLCESYLLSGDEELRVPAQKAIDFIVEAQHTEGGWRYQPRQAGDTSVFGWQLMALQSARVANLTVPPETLQLAGHYLDAVQSHEGSRYAYMPRNNPTEVMTAEALLCRMYMGWNKDAPGLVEGMKFLSDSHLPNRKAPNYYYWYYGTQAFHHLGGPEWERWNLLMRDILVNTQESRGKLAGSWPVQGQHASAGGRIYVTSLSICTLEVYYRHLPIFRQLDLD